MENGAKLTLGKFFEKNGKKVVEVEEKHCATKRVSTSGSRVSQGDSRGWERLNEEDEDAIATLDKKKNKSIQQGQT